MKKLFKLSMTALLGVTALSLTSCNDSKKVDYTFELSNITRSTVDATVSIIDTKSKVSSDSVYVYVYDEDDTQVTYANFTDVPNLSDDGTWDDETKTLTSLDSSTTYTAKLLVTIGSKQYTLEEKEFTTTNVGDDAQNAIHITSASDLSKISNDLDAYYILDTDLNYEVDSQKTEITPLFQSASTEFTGTFDGNGHTISGWKISSGYQYASFFGYISSGATIKNVNFDNAEIAFSRSAKTYVGTAVAYIEATSSESDQSSIENVNVTNTTLTPSMGASSSYALYVGGLVGYSEGANITGCSFEGEITSTSAQEAHVGGLIGVNKSSQASKITKSYANATIKANVSSTKTSFSTDSNENPTANLILDLGGFVGQNDRGIINNCYSTGTVSSTYQMSATMDKLNKTYNVQIGGFVGRNNGNINYVVANESIYFESYDAFFVNVGLLAGYLSDDSFLQHSSYIGTNKDVTIVVYDSGDGVDIDNDGTIDTSCTNETDKALDITTRTFNIGVAAFNKSTYVSTYVLNLSVKYITEDVTSDFSATSSEIFEYSEFLATFISTIVA